MAELLRSRGMRSTPQRRAILGVFQGGRTEHLSADEVYAQASRVVPELSRATVYATLAEFSELGLLAAVGSPEPVRYETMAAPHAHLRCQLCMRLFDLAGGQPDPGQIDDPGFIVHRIDTRAEGICDECTAYDAGLQAGAEAMIRTGPPGDTLTVPGTAATETDSPIGRLLLAATPHGLTRVAFEDHADADSLRAHFTARRGTQAARQHLVQACEDLTGYFAGDPARPSCVVDWGQLASTPAALQTTETIAYATHQSYSSLGFFLAPRELGLTFGANPIPIFAPCHRVSRGTEIPTSYVGGSGRRSWLDAHELTHPTV
jgi:Fe2+ or Zn2+ uptake regulation protein/O6-methylguanine-DNA--protein-cysteine methyltransferase